MVIKLYERIVFVEPVMETVIPTVDAPNIYAILVDV